ncbi:MAG TPA: hypothetical protein VGK05_08935 [Acidimicrobiia bacterium]|jgi:uncharacterized membrane protein YoaT (DUF817 family)
MPDHMKFVINAALALATLFLTAVLWRYPLALIALLLVTAVAILRIRPSATSVVVYATAFVFGPLAEAVSITTGAWAYDSPNFLGVPVWLPFVWGNAGLFILNMAELWKSLLAPRSSRAQIVDAAAPDTEQLVTLRPSDRDDEAVIRSTTGS